MPDTRRAPSEGSETEAVGVDHETGQLESEAMSADILRMAYRTGFMNPMSPMPTRRNEFFSSAFLANAQANALNSVSTPERPQSQPTSLTGEQNDILYRASMAHVRLAQSYHRNIPRERVDNRQREYNNLRHQQKPVSPEEAIHSEFPLQMSSLPHDLLTVVTTRLGIGTDSYTAPCRTCKRVVSIEYAFLLFGNTYCGEHVPDFKLCSRCGSRGETKAINTFDGRAVLLCNSCLRQECNSCERRLEQEYCGLGYCANCISRPRIGGPFRPFSWGLSWVDTKEKGSIVQSPRMFSSEVEVLLPSPAHLTNIHNHLPNEGGISEDSSIHGHGLAIELQTPRLAGKHGEEFVYRMASVLRDAKATTNETCGMHVHLDGKGLIRLDRRAYPLELLQLWKAYLVFEDVIQSFVPYARRNNRYCQPLSRAFNLFELNDIETLADAEKLWYRANTPYDIHNAKSHHHHSSRYFGINLHPLFSNGHMEVRYHGGTRNARKILRWANLHVLIIDAAVALKFTTEFMHDAMASSLTEKTEMLFSLIGLSEENKRYFRERQVKFSNKSNQE